MVEHTAENRGVAGSIPALAISALPRATSRAPNAKNDVRAGATAPRTSLGQDPNGVVPGGKDGDRSRCELLDVAEADLAEAGAELLGRDPDRSLGSPRRRRRSRCRPARHAAELLEERDHVLEDDEVEGSVRKRQARAVRDLEGDAPASSGGSRRFASSTISVRDRPRHLGVRERSAHDARGLPGPRAEIEHLAGRLVEPVEGRAERDEALRARCAPPRSDASEPNCRRIGPRKSRQSAGRATTTTCVARRGRTAVRPIRSALSRGVRRSSSPTDAENICAASPRLMASAMFA